MILKMKQMYTKCFVIIIFHSSSFGIQKHEGTGKSQMMNSVCSFVRSLQGLVFLCDLKIVWSHNNNNNEAPPKFHLFFVLFHFVFLVHFQSSRRHSCSSSMDSMEMALLLSHICPMEMFCMYVHFL